MDRRHRLRAARYDVESHRLTHLGRICEQQWWVTLLADPPLFGFVALARKRVRNLHFGGPQEARCAQEQNLKHLDDEVSSRAQRAQMYGWQRPRGHVTHCLSEPALVLLRQPFCEPVGNSAL